METLIVTPKNKQSITFLKHLLGSLPDVKNVQIVNAPTGSVAKSIETGLNDVKQIMSGKKKGKTLTELLDED
jgi:hypothetical protein